MSKNQSPESLGLVALPITDLVVQNIIYTPLQEAVIAENKDSITTLLAEGADINGKDATIGETALHVALRYGKIEMAKFLISNGADPVIESDTGTSSLDLIDALAEDVCDAIYDALTAQLEMALDALGVANTENLEA